MQKTKKFMVLLLFVTMVCSLLSGCGGNSSAATSADSSASDSSDETQSAMASSTMVNLADLTVDESRDNTETSGERYDKVTTATSIDVTELLPYNVDDSGKASIMVEMYEALYDMYGLDDYRPRLATGDPEIIDDTHYQVTIYDYIYDWEGNQITASDVVFSYELAKDSGYGYDWDYYESCEAVDDYTVQFTFTEPLDSLTAFYNLFTKVYIVSEEAYGQHNFATDPVGTGPYKLTSFATGSSVVLDARDDYWQTEDLIDVYAESNVQTIEFDIVGDDSLALVALEEGDSDYKFMRDDYSVFEEGGEYYGKVNLYANSNTQNHTFLPNCSEDSVCSDINLRLAIFYAIDSQGICTAVSADTKTPSSVDLSANVADYQSEWDTYAADTYQNVYDPELAKEYLEKSSYDGSTLVILTESNDEKKMEAQLLQGYLTAIGINSELAVYDHSVINTYVVDSTCWDIFIYSGNANDYSVSKWLVEYGAANNNGTTINYIEDDYIQDTLNTLSTLSGYSEELVYDFGVYLIDNAYAYGTYYSSEIYAFTPKFATVVSNFFNTIMFGSCEYYLDV